MPVIKIGNLLFTFRNTKDGYTYIDEVSEFTPEMWNNLKEKVKMSNEKEKRFVKAGGILPDFKYEPEKTDVSPKHFDMILGNNLLDAWIGADSKVILISDMPDQYLINTMRFLMRNWKSIELAFRSNMQKAPAITRRQMTALGYNDVYNSAPYFFSRILPCFDNLAEECNKRFGNKALRALYDGN